MRKNFFLSWLIFCGLFCFVAWPLAAGAQAPAEPPSDPPPVTEEEVQLYLEYLKKLPATSGDQARIKRTQAQAGFSDRARLLYVGAKCHRALGLLKHGPGVKARLPESALWPTEEELALVKKYRAEFERLRPNLLELRQP